MLQLLRRRMTSILAPASIALSLQLMPGTLPGCIAAPGIPGLQTNKNALPPAPAKMVAAFQAMPLLFTENRGQIADADGKPRPDILFTAHSGDVKLFLTATGIHYQFTKIVYPDGYEHDQRKVTDPAKQAALAAQVQTSTYRFSLELAGANPHPAVLKESKNDFTENFYTSNSEVTGVATYEKVVYQDVYPHIDWIVYSNGQHMKYDFLVHPGGDPSQIKLKIKDAGGISITPAGELLMTTSLGEIKEQAPLSFVGNRPIATHFKKNSDGTIGFNVAAQPGRELRIDPSVLWSTYYGGTGTDYTQSCVADTAGNVYMSGITGSNAGIAISGAQQTTYGGGNADGLLVKFNAAGIPQWATYYGGVGNEEESYCSVNSAGDICFAMNLAGKTSTGLATTGALYTAPTSSAENTVLVKFNNAGVRQWATYYNGTGVTTNHAAWCFIDNSGNVYMSGTTSATNNIASAGAFQTTFGGSSDGFLVKFNTTGTRQWATYYGGSNNESVSCAVDNSGNIFIGGTTASTTGISTNGTTNTNVNPTSNNNFFLAKFNASGARQWGTYCGGPANQLYPSLATDPSGNVYLTGLTTSTTGIATTGAYEPTLNSSGTSDFIFKFDGSGTLLWGTYYNDAASSILPCLTDAAGNLFVAGSTQLPGMSYNGFQSSLNGTQNGIITKFSTIGSRLWGSYFGGNNVDAIDGITSDGKGNLFITGSTTSTMGLATTGAYQSANGGGTDAFLAKIGDVIACIPTVDTVGDTICSTQLPYNWNGMTITAGGTINDTLINAGGCDSIVTLNLLVKQATTSTVTATICANELPYSWNGKTVTVGGLAAAMDTLVNAVGCDSVITLSLQVNNNVIPSVQISADDTDICAGALITFKAVFINGGTTPLCQWQKNGINTGNNSIGNSTLIYNSLVNGDVISCVLTSSATCALPLTDSSNGVTITVHNNVTPTAGITASANTICSGNPVTFTATSSDGGTTPIYLWTKNGVAVGTDTTVYMDSNMSSQDTIACILTSNAACATDTTVSSNTETITVNPSVPATVAISANPNGTICGGSPVIFTAAPNNGGTAPTYSWTKNGNTVDTNSTYTDNGPANGDIIILTMTSNATCASDIAIDSLTENVHPTPVAQITANGNELSTGSFTTYQWFHNGSAINGAMSQNYTATEDGIYTVIVTDGNGCAATSATDTVTGLAVTTITTAEGNLQLYPNPNNGSFILQGMLEGNSRQIKITVLNTIGQVVYQSSLPVENNLIKQQLQLPAVLPGGAYLLQAKTDNNNSTVIRFIIER